jgi:hypothetical protein
MKKVPSTPSNNKTKPSPQPPEVGPAVEEKKPESFSISMAGVDELVACLNETVQSKYVKQVIFQVLNTELKPIFSPTKDGK